MDINFQNLENNIIFCVSKYIEKYYFNDLYKDLPTLVKKDLFEKTIMLNKCVGGIIIIGFDEDGDVFIRATCEENDFEYDEIFAALNVKEFQKIEGEFLISLSKWYNLVYKTKNGLN